MKASKSLKKWVRITLILVVLALVGVGSYLVLNAMSVTKTENDDILYSYKVKPNLDYKVYLFKNSFIDKEYQDMTEDAYLSDLVNTIKTNFKYQYQASDISDLNYTYDVKALLQGKYKLEEGQDKVEVWSEEYELIPEKKIELTNSNQFAIDEIVDIDYHFYDEKVSAFRQNLKLPITANLFVTMNINVKGSFNSNGEKKEFEDNKTIKMTVPLNQQAFNITSDFQKEDSKTFTTSSIEETKKVDKTQVGIGGALICAGLIVFVVTFKKIFNIKEKSYYEQKRDRYLKEYGDVIIEVVTPVAKKDLKIITVKDLGELVDLEEELRIPIVFYEDPDDFEGEFSIVHDDIMYEYVLTNEEDE